MNVEKIEEYFLNFRIYQKWGILVWCNTLLGHNYFLKVLKVSFSYIEELVQYIVSTAMILTLKYGESFDPNIYFNCNKWLDQSSYLLVITHNETNIKVKCFLVSLYAYFEIGERILVH